MIENLSYHTNTVAEFTVYYNEVYLTTDNIFVTPRNKIYEHIYVSRKEPRKFMSFKQAPPRHTNLNWSLHPPILLKGSKLVTQYCVCTVWIVTNAGAVGVLSNMKSSVVQWTAEAALQAHDITMITSQRAAASHLGDVASVWQHW